jgi:hypothetical protein
LFAMSPPKRPYYEPPELSRTTSWTAERVAALPEMLDVRQLLANAERLGEEALAALCTAEIVTRRRESLRSKPAAPPKGKKSSAK